MTPNLSDLLATARIAQGAMFTYIDDIGIRGVLQAASALDPNGPQAALQAQAAEVLAALDADVVQLTEATA